MYNAGVQLGSVGNTQGLMSIYPPPKKKKKSKKKKKKKKKKKNQKSKIKIKIALKIITPIIFMSSH